MVKPHEDDEDENAERLRQLGLTGEEDGDGVPCPDCKGERLNRISRAVKLHLRSRRQALSLPALLACPPAQLLANLENLELDERGRLVTRDIVPQIRERLRFMDHVGLGYLSLDRPTKTLSGGEAQRIRLAAQLGTNLAGVLYVLDEPSIGLHARDNQRLISTLLALRDKGNTLVVVEHDDELMARADLIIDLGPAAGVHGGELLARGTPAQIRANGSSLTGVFLAKGITHPLRGDYRDLAGIGEPWIELKGARHRNLKGVDLRLPPGRLTMVAGPERRRQVDALSRPARAGRRLRDQGRASRGSPGGISRGIPARRRSDFAELRNARRIPLGDRGRPVADRQDPAVHARHLPRDLRPHPEVLRVDPRGQDPRLHRVAILVQHRGRTVPGLRGRGPDPPRDGVHARHLPALRRLPGPALRARALGRDLEGPVDRDGAAADLRGGGGILQLPLRARRRSAG